MIIASAISSCLSYSANRVKDAVDEGFFLLSQVGYSNQRKYAWLRYWPSYVAGAIAVASTVATIAYALINNIPNAIFHGCVALGSLILAGTLHIFIPLKQLEKQTADLQEQNGRLRTEADRIGQEERALKALNSDLRTQIETQRKTKQELESNLQLHLSRFQETAQRLLDSEKKVRGLEELLHSIQMSSEGFQAQVMSIQSIQQDITHKGIEFDRATDSLAQVASSLTDGLRSLQGQHTVVAGEYNTALQFADNLQKLFLSIQDIYRKTREEEAKLKEEVSQLQQAVLAAQQSTSSFGQDMESIAHMIQFIQRKEAEQPPK